MKRLMAAIAAALILPACGGGPSGQKTQTPTPGDPGIETLPDEGREHVPLGTPIVYQTDPPTSGPHYEEIVQEGGFFDHDILPPYLVHSMEHGAVIIYYSPAVTDDQLKELRDLVKGHTDRYSQIVCLPRNDATYPIILTAWDHRLRLTEYDKDRIDGFVALFLGQGPEKEPM